MRLARLSLLTLLVAACDSTTGPDLDIGEFVGTDAGVRVAGDANHDLEGARAQGDATVPFRFRLNPDDTGEFAILTVYIPTDEAFGATHRVADGLRAELVRYDADGNGPAELATDGTVETQPQSGRASTFRVFGSVALTFASGEVVGEFRAVQTGYVYPGCSPTDCTDV